MRISVTFRHTEPTDALKKYAREKVEKITRFLDRPQEAHITLSVEKIRHIAEVVIVADGLTTTGKESTNDLYSAIDKVVDKLERRLKKGKSKRRTLKQGKGESIRTMKQASQLPNTQKNKKIPSGEKEEAPSIVQSNLFLPKPMTIEDAAVELAAGKMPLVVFRNYVTHEICVLHKNSDGTLGLVEPSNT